MVANPSISTRNDEEPWQRVLPMEGGVCCVGTFTFFYATWLSLTGFLRGVSFCRKSGDIVALGRSVETGVVALQRRAGGEESKADAKASGSV